MKIAILVSHKNVTSARSVMMHLETKGLDTIGLKINERWRDVNSVAMTKLLYGTTHLLCPLDNDDEVEAWLSYFVGFARGSNTSLALFAVDPDYEPGSWISDMVCFRSLEAAASYYTREGIEWDLKEGRRLAKASLLELGISWHAESLAQCVLEGDTKAVVLFLDSGFPPDIRDKNGVPMLCLAARSRHKSIVELLLDRGASIDAQSEDRGYSALMDAVQQGDESLLDLLLERSAQTDLQSKDGQTALVLAVGRSDAAIAKRLLSCGSNPDIVDKLGLSARKYAKLFHNASIDEVFSAFN
ncbi:ankyrin repeat domain-containing protein [Spirochaetota bacterium]